MPWKRSAQQVRAERLEMRLCRKFLPHSLPEMSSLCLGIAVSNSGQCCSSGGWTGPLEHTCSSLMLIQEQEPSQSRTSEGIKHTELTELCCRAGSNLNLLQNALRSACSGLASTPAGWKELREMGERGEEEERKALCSLCPPKAAFHCGGSQPALQTCLPFPRSHLHCSLSCKLFPHSV